jgi:hypothetical protein
MEGALRELEREVETGSKEPGTQSTAGAVLAPLDISALPSRAGRGTSEEHQTARQSQVTRAKYPRQEKVKEKF